MGKKMKVILALFLAFAVMFQYSFSSQSLVAYGLDNTDSTVQAEEATGDEGQPADVQEATEPTTEATEPTEPAAEEEQEAYPATQFSETAGGVAVSISAPEGALPEGATVKVKAVKAETIQDAVEELIENAEVVKAVDITFYNKEGREIEPKKNVSVTFTSKEFKKLSEAKVVHINDDGVAEAVSGSTVAGSKATFKADDFSIYAIIDDDGDEVPQRTYKFVNEVVDGSADAYNFLNKAGQTVDNQIIKEGDVLEDVGTPRLVGKSFLGWYELSGENGSFTYTNNKVNFETPITGVTKETVYVAPKYEAVYYVTFHENASGSDEDIIQTKKVVYTSGSDANRVLISDVIAPQADENHIFYGWMLGDTKYSVYDNTGQIKETYIENIRQDEDLYPDFEEAYWLRFVSAEHGASATYIESMFVLANNTLTKLPVPTRPGYHFVGWYTGSQTQGEITYDSEVTGADGTVTIEGGLKLTEETTLYGKWVADTGTTYNVVFWKQKVTDDKDASDSEKTYDYWGSSVRTGATGSAAAPTDADTSREETGFHYSRYDTTSQTIKADGSTTVNVYYDRDLVSINFYYRDSVEGGSPAYQYTPTTSDSESPQQYGVLPDGSYVPVFKISSSISIEVYYTYSSWFQDIRYTGTFYTREWEWYHYVYTATQYNGDNPPPDDSVTYYGYTGEGISGYSALTRHEVMHTQSQWGYMQGDQIVVYNGTRYHRENMSGYNSMVTFTGLYGQNFGMYDYEWPASIVWNEEPSGSGVVQTFLDDFTYSDAAYNLYERGSNGSYSIYHYKQTLNGNYSEAARYVAHSTSEGARPFHFSNKFDGFNVVSYSTSFNQQGRGTSVSDGSEANVNYPIHIYHERASHNFIYKSGNTEGRTTSVKYGAPLGGMNISLEDAGFEEIEHYVFTGWYADETCTSKFVFNSAMPNANVVVYAGFKKESYDVRVDPNGGVITSDIGATYFTLDYGDKITRYNGVKREYIEDPNGDYKYVINFTPTARSATYELAEEGYTGTRYRPITSADPTYTLVGWYEVIDGVMSSEPYDFDAPVTKDTMIRAKWKLSGGYKLQYTAVSTVMVDGEPVEVSGTFTQSEPNALYADLSETIAQATPTNVTQGFVFDGWEVVADDATGTTLDDNNGNYYQTGDVIILHAAWANSNKQIHIRAHYSSVEDSDMPVSITSIYYDPNQGTTSLTTGGDITVGEDGVVCVSPIQINKRFNLFGADKFSREGYTLLGWNTDKSAANNGVVEFECGQLVAADNLPNDSNTLYAVWKLDETLEVEALTKSWKYDAQNHYGAVTKVVYNDEDVTENLPENITFEYQYKKSDGTWSDSTQDPCFIKNVGQLEYRVRASISGVVTSEWAEGTLTVTKRKVTVNVTLSDKEYTYNGQLQSYYAEWSFDTEDTVLKAEPGYGPHHIGAAQANYAAGRDAGEYHTTASTDAASYLLCTGLTADWLNNYDPTYDVTQGTLTIKNATMTLTPINYGGGYDGLYHAGGATCSQSAAVKTYSIYDPVSGTWSGYTTKLPFIRNAGEVKYKVKAELKNYDTVEAEGRLVLSKANLTIIVNDQTYTYDGSPKGQDAGKFTGEAAQALLSFDGKKSADELEFVYMNEYKETESGTYEKTLSVNTREELRMAYTPNTTYEPSVTKGVFDVDTNYVVKYVNGDLIIDPATMTLSTINYAGEYNGQYHAGGATCSQSSAKISYSIYDPDTDTWSDYTTKLPYIRNAGEVRYKAKAELKNYEPVEKEGVLRLSKADLTITVNDQSYVYNGTPQGQDAGQFTGETARSLVALEGKSNRDTLESIYMKEYKETNAGTYAKTLSVDEAKAIIMSYSKDSYYEGSAGTGEFKAETNYNIKFVKGNLEITKRPITVTFVGTKKTETYDGTEKTNNDYSLQISDRLYHASYVEFVKKPVITETNAGEYALNMTAKDMKDNSAQTLGHENFDVKFAVEKDLELVINKRAVKVTFVGTKKTEEFDGTEKTNDEYSLRISDRIYHASYVGFSKKPVITQTNAGEYKLNMTAGDMSDDSAQTLGHENFNVTFEVEKDLELEITRKPITISVEGNTGEFLYDGTQKEVSGFTVVNPEDVPEGLTVLWAVTTLLRVQATDAGYYPLPLSENKFVLDGEGADNYDATFEIASYGGLTIDKRELTLTSATDSKVYDGTPLRNDEVTIGGDGLAEGETIEFDVTGEQTEVGSSPNEFTYKILKPEQSSSGKKRSAAVYTASADDEAAGPEKNYNVDQVFGTLTVTAPGGDDSDDNGGSGTKTGDDTNLIGLLAAMTAALAGLIALVAVRRRED